MKASEEMLYCILVTAKSLNMRAFVIPPSRRLPQGELYQGKRHHRGSKAKTGLVHSEEGD